MVGVLRPPSATGVILAGGESSRMGRDKALIPVGGVPMLRRAADAVAAVCAEVLIIGDQAGREELELPPRARWVADVVRGRGPLGGVHAGLAAASHETVFAASCDMPLLNSWLITVLLGIMQQDAMRLYSAVVPRVGQASQTLHAVYRRSCVEEAERLLSEEERPGLQSLLRKLRVLYVDEERLTAFDLDMRSMMSVNTQEDLDRAERLLQGAY